MASTGAGAGACADAGANCCVIDTVGTIDTVNNRTTASANAATTTPSIAVTVAVAVAAAAVGMIVRLVAAIPTQGTRVVGLHLQNKTNKQTNKQTKETKGIIHISTRKHHHQIISKSKHHQPTS